MELVELCVKLELDADEQKVCLDFFRQNDLLSCTVTEIKRSRLDDFWDEDEFIVSFLPGRQYDLNGFFVAEAELKDPVDAEYGIEVASKIGTEESPKKLNLFDNWPDVFKFLEGECRDQGILTHQLQSVDFITTK